MSDREDRLNAVLVEFFDAVAQGRHPDRVALLRAHPDLAADLAAVFADHDRVRKLAEPLREPGDVTLGYQSTGDLNTVRYFGDYEVIEEVARGGMGVVYKARQKSLDRIVAVKMILAGKLASDADVQRFQQEARMAGKLQHPGIVALHEVGQHQGQHFYSMDFIEGQSLAQLVREQPLPPDRAIRYVRAVAEAVQFAHENGVLHRDLKPSNVLIDRADQPRVTDFGLARNIHEEAGLTSTGAVLGTPSYMPPEQASAARGQLSPASDTYALCAILYELVTGRPPFRAATTFDTLLQVLDADPAPPRQLNPQLSRDLETVLLTGLQKDPARRYASAAALAAELTALLEGRPIQARPPSALERAGRWLHQQGRTVRTALTSVGVALLAILFLWLYFEWHWQASLGGVTFDTDGPALLAEVFDADGANLVVPPFTAPNQQPLRLPEGDYRVRLSAPYTLSETYRLLVQRGRSEKYQIDLASRRAADPLLSHGVFAFIPRGPGHDLATVVAPDTLHLYDAAGALRWSFTLGPDGKRVPAGTVVPPEQRTRFFLTMIGVNLPDTATLGGEELRPRLVEPGVDLDGDGMVDQVWTPWNGSGLLALSGQTGAILWYNRDLPNVRWPGFLLHEGRPLLIALSGSRRLTLDGRTGQALGEPVDVGCTPDRAEWQQYQGKPALVCLAGTRLHTLDPHTGQPLRPPVDLGQTPQGFPALTDLDGDGLPEAVFRSRAVIRAIATATGAELWSHDLPERLGWEGRNSGEGFLRAPLPVVLKPGDPCVLVPDERGRLALLDGRTGAVRWRNDLHINQGWPSGPLVLVAPDLDGDGTRDVFVANFIASASRIGNYFHPLVRVQLVSGKTGAALWRTRFPLPDGAGYEESGQGHPLLTWQTGLDGWPQLVVPGKFHTLVLDSSTGRIAHVLPRMRGPARALDLDGDGLPELVCYQPPGDDTLPGRLHVFRGTRPEAWQRLGEWTPGQDRNGDGIADLTRNQSPGPVVSGRDGALLAAQGPPQPAKDAGFAFERRWPGPVTFCRAPVPAGAPARPRAEPIEVVPLPWADKLDFALDRGAVLAGLLVVAWVVWRVLRDGARGARLPLALYLALLVGLLLVYLIVHRGAREPWQHYGWGGWHALPLLTLVFGGILLLPWLVLAGLGALVVRWLRATRRGREAGSTPASGAASARR